MILESQDLLEFALLDFELPYDLSPLSFFQFFLFGTGMPTLYLSHHHISEAHNLSGVTGSQLERNFASDELDLESHPNLI